MENDSQGKIYSFVRCRGFKEPYRQDNLSLKEAKALFKQEVDAIKYMVLQKDIIQLIAQFNPKGAQ
ncbi:MAG: hypothetical protein ABIL44_00955 [candidate division WOR-3 bacterium]